MLETHQYINHLKSKKFTEIQAEAIIKVINDIRKIDMEQIITKTDLQLAIEGIKLDIGNIRLDCNKLELRMIVKLGTMIGVSTGIIAALIRMLPA